MTRSLLYFADPMCSWCWGFSPVVRSLVTKYAAALPVRVVMGGLSAGATVPLDEQSKTAIRDHWEHVEMASGQPFDYGFFERKSFIDDTEPSCRAMVAARELEPSAVLPFLAALQGAFYGDNRDITDAGTLIALATEFGLERVGFAEMFDRESTRSSTYADFALARQMRISGFPTIVGCGDQGALQTLSDGYQDWQALEPIIEQWLGEQWLTGYTCKSKKSKQNTESKE